MEQSVLNTTVLFSKQKKTSRFIGKPAYKLFCCLFLAIGTMCFCGDASAQFNTLSALSITANGSPVSYSPSISAGTTSFSGNVAATSVTVSVATMGPSSISINGGPPQPGSISQNVSLTSGTNTITIVVTSLGSTTYTIFLINGATVNSISPASSSPTNATSLNFNVTLSAAASGFSSANFSLATTGTAAGTISSVSGSGTAYTVTVSNVTGDGTIGVNFSNPTGVTPTLPSTQVVGGAYTVKHSHPFVTSIVPSGTNPTNSTNPAFTVNFSDPVTGVDATDFTAVTNGVGASNLAVTQVSQNTYTVSLNASGTGTVRLDLNDGTGITDLAGNQATGFTKGEQYSIDNVPPAVSNISYASNDGGGPLTAVTGDIISLTFTASEPVKTPLITIAGHSVTATSNDNINWTANYTLLSTDTRGRVPFTLQATDLTGNISSNYTDVTQNTDIELGGTAEALSTLTVDQGTLSPAFLATTIAYTDTVANNVSAINITPTPVDPTATVTVNGLAPAPVSLNIGDNIIPVTVASQDGSITSTYTITVTRPSLAPAIGSFSPQNGAIGTVVTIKGANLSAPTSFTIGGQNAVIISNDGSTLVAMVMPNATTGGIGLTTNTGSVNSNGSFTVTATPAPTQQLGGTLPGVGQSVAISADGSTALAGAPNDNNGVGAVWAYTMNNGVWTQQSQKLAPSDGSFPQFGYWSALSADGNTAVIGGPYDNGSKGAVWVFTRTNGTWTQQGPKLVGSGMVGNGFLGWTVALSADGNTAVTGGPRDNSNIGATWVFTRSNGIWSQQGSKLVVSGNSGKAAQGNVSISADGKTIMSGGPDDGNLTGAVWVFTLSNGTWTQQGPKIVPSDITASGEAGYTVALSADGNTAVIGGDDDNSGVGAIWMYTRSGGTWTQQGSKLVGTGGSNSSFQGFPVAISADGSTVMEGGYFDNSRAGAIWAFTKNGSVWTQKGQKIVASGTGPQTYFGSSLSLSATGNAAFVGSFNGGVWAYTPASAPTSQAGDLNFTGTTNTTTTAAWGNGNGTARAVFISQASSGNAAPVNNTTYIANTVFASGTQIGSSGWYCVYNGTGTNTNITGLTINTSYNVMVVDYNGTAGAEQYLTTAGTGNPATFTTLASPDATLSNLTITPGSLNPSFSSGTANYYSNAGYGIGTVTLTPTSSNAGATIKVNNTPVTSGTGIPVNLNVGKNIVNITVLAQDNSTTQTYTDTITRAASSNANLLKLVTTCGIFTPAFSNTTYAYTRNVPYATTSITFTPTTVDTSARVTVNGSPVPSGTASAPQPLKVGNNTITVVVIAGDKTTTKTFVVTVTRAKSADATLSGLSINPGTIKPDFLKTTTVYAVAAGNGIKTITVTPTTNDTAARVKVNGIPVPSGTASDPITLALGSNLITVQVTAQNGIAIKNYVITVNRVASSNAKLLTLNTSNGVLTPGFNNTTNSYTKLVNNGVTAITFTPTTVDTTAVVFVNGVPTASGTPSASLPLKVGDNVDTIRVKAQDSITTISYVVTVTRAPSSNAKLLTLNTSSGVLTPGFNSSTTTYTKAVNNGVTVIAFTPTTIDTAAVVFVNGIKIASGTASASIPLQVGDNIDTIQVKAQDSVTVMTYVVTVTRAPSSNARLLNLVTSNGVLSPGFNTNTTSYTRAVGNATTSITFTPTAVDPTATITVNGVKTASGTASAALHLNVGANQDTIKVTAQDSVTTMTYVITVNRATGPLLNSVYDPTAVARPNENPMLNNEAVNVHQSLSPNGDGINDFLLIDGITNHPDNKLQIMNRSGQLVFEASGYDNSTKVFDGHSNKNGQMQLPGTYFYSLEYTVKGETKRKTGFIILKY